MMKCLFALLPLFALAPSALGRPTNSSCSRWGSKHRNSTSELLATNSTLVNSDASEKWSAGGWQGSWNITSDSSPSDAPPSAAASASAASAAVVAPTADVSSSAAVSPAGSGSTSFAAGAALATGSASDSGSSSSSSSFSASAGAPASMDPTTSSAPAPATSSAAAGASSTDIDTLLSLHNNLRAQYGASAVTWNDTLAAYAQADASTCVYGHTNGSYGENISAIGGSGADLTGDFNLWANEAAQYDWNNPGYSDATGHFTQIVWKATTQIGCGWQTCGANTIFKNFTADSLYLVCEYMARGNIVGDSNQYFIDNVGTYGS